MANGRDVAEWGACSATRSGAKGAGADIAEAGESSDHPAEIPCVSVCRQALWTLSRGSTVNDASRRLCSWAPISPLGIPAWSFPPPKRHASLQSRPGDGGQMDACICSPLIYPLQDLVISPHLLYNPEHPRAHRIQADIPGASGLFNQEPHLRPVHVQSPGEKSVGGGRSSPASRRCF